MGSNLCQDNCDCGEYVFTLADFRDKPISFRSSGMYPPTMGTKLICPKCGRVYFGWVRYTDKFWSDPRDSQADVLRYGHTEFPNKEKGKFVLEVTYQGKTAFQDTGCYQIDLSYWETGGDEGKGVDSDNPSYQWMGTDIPNCRGYNSRTPE